ncbi:MAG: GNAT family N-acetyltransferase [Rhodanobacteraceae bacterium]
MEVRHDSAAHRFSVEVEGHTGTIDYELRDGVMTVTHTRVPEAIGGRGVAAELTRTALDTARANGWKVIPQCPYTAAYMRRHHEFGDLL